MHLDSHVTAACLPAQEGGVQSFAASGLLGFLSRSRGPLASADDKRQLAGMNSLATALRDLSTAQVCCRLRTQASALSMLGWLRIQASALSMLGWKLRPQGGAWLAENRNQRFPFRQVCS